MTNRRTYLFEKCNTLDGDIGYGYIVNFYVCYDEESGMRYAKDISVSNITAKGFINAKDISYWAICIAYSNIKCNSIKGRRENSKHFVLDGTLEVIE